MKSATLNKSQKIFGHSNVFLGRAALVQAICFILGLLMSRGMILGKYFPFAMSVVASVPYSGIISSVLGAFIGYIIPMRPGLGIRYISAVLAIAALRWALNDLNKIKKLSLYAPLVAFAPTLITGIAMNSVNGFESYEILMSFIEALMSAGTSYFLCQVFRSVLSGKTTMLNQQEIACFVVSLCIIILSLSNVTFGAISLGRVIAIIMIFSGAYCLGVAGGSISGTATGVIFSLPTFGLSYISGSYAFGGMIAGLFSRFGKSGVCAAFLLSNTLLSFQAGNIERLISGVYEILIAIFVFLFIPNSFFDKMLASIPDSEGKSKASGLYKYITRRLKLASETVLSVPNIVGQVSDEVCKSHTPKVKDICMKAVYSTCSKCSLRVLCWENDYERTKKAFDTVTLRLSEGKSISFNSFPEEFITRCCKKDVIIQQINRYHREFKEKRVADKRVKELREVISEQLKGMGSLLGDMSMEIEEYVQFDEKNALKVHQRLTEKQFRPINVVYKTDKLGKIYLEIDIEKNHQLDKECLLDELSKICGREFGTPCISISESHMSIKVCEKPVYSVEIGSAQHICGNGNVCGDKFTYFDDGAGHFILIISDGMGTGGRAAIDGSIAAQLMSKLIKSNISFDCAVKIVNSALIVKSEDESLATLDIISINLFTGEAVFMKAGAPSTLLRSEGRIISINAASLPIGILNDAELLYDKYTMKEGEWILMMSDGVSESGYDSLEEEFLSWTSGSPQELAKHIVNKASKRANEGHDDDITAVAVKLNLNI